MKKLIVNSVIVNRNTSFGCSLLTINDYTINPLQW